MSLELVVNDIYNARESFDAAIAPGLSINFESEASFAVQIVTANEYLLKVAKNARQSMHNAIVNVAAIGLTLNPAKKQAYLVPRKVGKQGVVVCLDVGWGGLIDLAVEAGAIMWAKAHEVYANDEFQRTNDGTPPHHKFKEFTDRGDLVAIYVVSKLPNGDFLTEVMTVGEINDIRDRSEAFKAYQENKISKTPWVDDWLEMAKKTVVRRASKWWRGRGNTARLERAIHMLDTQGDGMAHPLENVPVGDEPEERFDSEYWIKRVKAATTDEAVMRVYHEGVALITKLRDMANGAIFKRAVVDRRKQLAAKDGAEDATYTNRKAA
ncbi:recombinase RecT [Piscinibacter gummiphilus]|uniref:Recombinase RecT n=1 Tax=Piscinibacter gummiphilus TaxID=946333 RepID=A0ABZ0CNI1_9BURK|nr:recombinase RecT [Piscinibacter gummiphilus]WOB06550.1 recombinase RecT [Piscinibacter gummiphilus]